MSSYLEIERNHKVLDHHIKFKSLLREYTDELERLEIARKTNAKVYYHVSKFIFYLDSLEFSDWSALPSRAMIRLSIKARKDFRYVVG